MEKRYNFNTKQTDYINKQHLTYNDIGWSENRLKIEEKMMIW